MSEFASMPSPNQYFSASVPPLFLVHTLQRLARAYRDANDEVTGAYEAPEAHDVVGHVMRAKFEGAWRGLSRMDIHRLAGITSASETNRRRTSNFTVARCGNVAMTVSAVNDPETVVRHASFRNEFSEPQAGLFTQNEPKRPITQLYALIIHGRESRRNPSRVGFAHVVYPMLDCETNQVTGYHHERLDLKREYGGIVEAADGLPEHQILDTLRIELKRQKGIG